MNNHFKIISLIGAPCSGKGTLATKLSNDLGFLHISTGDIFRKNILENTEVGKEAKYYVENGLLCPDELGFKIVLDFLKNNNENIILDGFPRTINDYEFLRKNNIVVTKYIILNVPNSVLMKRADSRLIHEKSGRTYNKITNPPKRLYFDDITGEPLIQRNEDQKEMFLKRLNIFNKKTLPLIQLIKINKENVKQVFDFE